MRTRWTLVSEVEQVKKVANGSVLIGAYLLTAMLYVGFGRLSRLRPEIAGKPQLCSMNFSTETWSA